MQQAQAIQTDWDFRDIQNDFDVTIWGSVTDDDGSTYVAGRTEGSLADSDFFGEFDAWIAKFSPDGELLWIETLGTEEDDRYWGIGIQDNYVYVTGRTYSDFSAPIEGEGDIWVGKYDLDGNLIWIEQYGTEGWEGAAGVGADAEGNVYAVGNSVGLFGSPTQQANKYDIVMVKYDQDGNLIWDESFGTDESEFLLKGVVDDQGNLYAAGRTYGALVKALQGPTDGFVSVHDTDGNEVFIQQIGGASADGAMDVHFDDEGFVYMTGFTYSNLAAESLGGSDTFTAQYSPAGELLWVKQIGTDIDDFGLAVVTDDQNGIVYVASYSELYEPTDNPELSELTITLWLSAYDKNGNLLYHMPIEADYNDIVRDIDIDAEGNLYLSGFSEELKGSLHEPRPTGLAAGTTAATGKDPFVIKINAEDLPPATLAEPLPGTFVGTVDNDYLFGTDDSDTVVADSGNDVISTFIGDDFIEAGDGNDIIIAGDGNDLVSAGTGDDFIGPAGGEDLIIAGSGNDTVVDFFGNDTYFLGDGDDFITDNFGNDYISGDGGNDFIEGGGGSDVLIGGIGADTFYYFSIAPGIIDSIEDYQVGEDQLLFNSSEFNNLAAGTLSEDHFIVGTQAQDADDYFVYDDLTSILYFDPDGNGSEAAITIAEFTNNPNLSAADIVITDDPKLGTRGSDLIFGTSEGEFLNGKAGEDILYGFGGDDVIEGHDGSDVINAGAGRDVIVAAPGDDILLGGAGNDYLAGSIGEDYLDGGEGTDTLVGGDDQDTYVLHLDETSFDYIFGFNANGVPDVIEIDVEGYEDILEPGLLASESFVIGTAPEDGDDYFIYDDQTGNLYFDPDGIGQQDMFLIANLVDLPVLTGNEISIGTSFGSITGTAGDDFLEGAVGDNDEIFLALGGDDRVDAGSGDDILLGGDGNDNMIGTRGFDQLYGQDGDDFLFGGSDDDFLDGGEGDDLVNGGLNDDVLNGGNGNDNLDGEEGFDTLDGGDGNDFLYGDAGDDVLYGGAGVDDMNGGTENDTMYGGLGDDYMDGSQGDDLMFGDEGDDLMFGDEGDDFVAGGDGDDIVWGNLGNDSLYGNEGNDLLEGAWGEDNLYGGLGDDSLDGATSDDLLEGGQGNDVLQGEDGNDIVNGAGLTYSGLTAEIDDLSGGSDQDLFILGDDNRAFYLAAGNDDYAIVRDFIVGEDTIQLFGTPDNYILADSPIPGLDGAGLFSDTNENGIQDASDELIAIILGSTTLDLDDSSQFTYIGDDTVIIADLV